jgi:hypothetical protein
LALLGEKKKTIDLHHGKLQDVYKIDLKEDANNISVITRGMSGVGIL